MEMNTLDNDSLLLLMVVVYQSTPSPVALGI